MLPDPAASSLIPSIPQKIRDKIVDVAEVNQWNCLEEGGQWLENVDQTHLVLASGELVLQKNILNFGSVSFFPIGLRYRTV